MSDSRAPVPQPDAAPAPQGRGPPALPLLSDFPHRQELQTRWHDNDLYGHVNNVVYYSYFDTLINRYLIDEGGLDLLRSPAIGVCVESQCRYLESIAFPERLFGALRVTRLGNSSVRYEIGIFRHAPSGGSAAQRTPCALGSFVHVFVDRETRRPTPIPDGLRTALARLQGA